jgi:hypothetical protein
MMTNQSVMRMYSALWSKYRPAIVRMMVDSSTETPQEYKLSAHEFVAMNSKQKGGYHFTLEVSRSKAINNIRESMIAQDLLEVLRTSPKATELSEESVYHFTMDKQFVLRIKKISEPVANTNEVIPNHN